MHHFKVSKIVLGRHAPESLSPSYHLAIILLRERLQKSKAGEDELVTLIRCFDRYIRARLVLKCYVWQAVFTT